MKKICRMAAAGVGALALLSAAGGAWADQYGDDEDVNLVLEVDCERGALSMVVDSADVAMSEDTESAIPEGERWFDGTLGDVTVRDTRCAAQVADGAVWWVQGVASDFVAQDGQENNIEAKHLGWEPAFTDPLYAGSVAAGDRVAPYLEDTANEDGFDPAEGVELLVNVATSSNDPDVLAEDEWTANAKMILKVPDTVEDGGYVSVLTLSLFE